MVIEINKLKKLTVSIMFFSIFAAVFLFFDNSIVLASADSNAVAWDGQRGDIQDATGLGDTDIRVVIAKLINYFLGFLGIIALVIIMYAGYIWMTSGGEEAKIRQAKDMLKNALIGLLIIMMSFAIVSFLLGMFDLGNGSSPTHPGGGPAGGFGVLGACSIISVYPEPNQQEVPRNTLIMTTFRQAVATSTFVDISGKADTDVIRIFHKSEESECMADPIAPSTCSSLVTDINVYSKDGKIIVFDPVEYLGSPSEYIDYGVYFTDDIKKLSNIGESIFKGCNNDYMYWNFEVSNKIDLDPPIVKSIFPPADNGRDDVSTTTAVQSIGSVSVLLVPTIYTAAVNAGGFITVVPGNDINMVTMDPHCADAGDFIVTVLPGGITATLSKLGSSVLLGSQDFENSEISFPGYFSISVTGHVPGNSWQISGVEAEKFSDTLTIGNVIYSFVSGSAGINQVQVGIDQMQTATNICNVLTNAPEHPDVDCSTSGTNVNILAKVAETAGDNIILTTNNSSSLDITSMSGGVDSVRTVTVQGGAADVARNAVIQINFNEAMNPLTLVGTADEVELFIRIENVNTNMGACSLDGECASFNCATSTATCVVGDTYLNGTFMVSNQYKTIEFISDNQCGVNACGEPIYCLPENANLRVEIEAANLITCTGDVDCQANAPFTICSAGPAPRHCQDPGTSRFFPMADLLAMDGAMDAAVNSLDGNKDASSTGPISYYDENIKNIAFGDSYRWMFFVNDQMDITPPIINTINPNLIASTSILAEELVTADFSKIMMSATLQSGSRIVEGGVLPPTEHQMVNIRAMSGLGIGYWIVKEDVDDSVPADEITDHTQGVIKHSDFLQSTSYRPQIGSGVKDIYQNCFKPSSGAGCVADKNNPSCCDGVETPSTTCP